MVTKVPSFPWQMQPIAVYWVSLPAIIFSVFSLTPSLQVLPAGGGELQELDRTQVIKLHQTEKTKPQTKKQKLPNTEKQMSQEKEKLPQTREEMFQEIEKLAHAELKKEKVQGPNNKLKNKEKKIHQERKIIKKKIKQMLK